MINDSRNEEKQTKLPESNPFCICHFISQYQVKSFSLFYSHFCNTCLQYSYFVLSMCARCFLAMYYIRLSVFGRCLSLARFISIYLSLFTFVVLCVITISLVLLKWHVFVYLLLVSSCSFLFWTLMKYQWAEWKHWFKSTYIVASYFPCILDQNYYLSWVMKNDLLEIT